MRQSRERIATMVHVVACYQSAHYLALDHEPRGWVVKSLRENGASGDWTLIMEKTIILR